MASKKTTVFDRLFKDQDGKVIIWQNPNILLWVWLGCSVLGFIVKHGSAHRGLQHLGDAALFAWAYLEIRSGESLFRRILGVLVIAFTIYGFFKS